MPEQVTNTAGKVVEVVTPEDLAALAQQLTSAPPPAPPPPPPPAPPPPPPPPPPGKKPVPESADGTTITAGSGTVIDATGAAWTLTGDGYSYIQQNGVNYDGGHGAQELVYHDHEVFVLGMDGIWYICSGGTFVVASNPLSAPPPAPSPPPPAPPPASIVSPSFYVDPVNGNDANNGLSTTAALKTLEQAQAAMRGSTTKHVYLRAGAISRTATLTLTSADNGEIWEYYPPDGVNTAVLDGGKTVDLVRGSGLSSITFNGLKLQNPFGLAFDLNGSNLVVENCDVGFNHDASQFGGFCPILSVQGTGNQVLHNYVHDTLSQGIAAYAFGAGTSIDGTVISGNVVLRAVQSTNDGGAIYLNMRNTNVNGGHVTVSNNFVRDQGNAGIQAEAMYFDDDSSNVTVTGNIFGPPSAALASGIINMIVMNGGASNTVSGNIIDCGRNNVAIAYEGPSGTGGTVGGWNAPSPNKITGNIILGNYAGAIATTNFDSSGHAYDQNPGSSSAWLAISGNLYHNYGGGAEDTTGNVISDASPVHQDPLASGWTYALASGSPALSSPISFQPIQGGWGPPGFTIPQNGTPPSCPH